MDPNPTPSTPDAPAPAVGTPAPVATPAPSTTPATSSFSWADAEGKFSEGWHDKLPEGLKGNPSLATINSLPLLAKAYIDTKSLVGKRVAPPAADATPDQVAEWRKTLGVPDAPGDYGSLMPEGFPKEMWDADAEKAFAALAHKHHIPPAALKEFAAFHAQGSKAVYDREVANAQAAIEKGRSELAAEWGDQMPRKIAEAKALAAAIGIPADHHVFSDADIVRKLAAAAPSLLGQDRLVAGIPATISGGIAEQIHSIQSGADYQGKNGLARQEAAAAQLRNLYRAQSAAKSAA